MLTFKYHVAHIIQYLLGKWLPKKKGERNNGKTLRLYAQPNDRQFFLQKSEIHWKAKLKFLFENIFK